MNDYKWPNEKDNNFKEYKDLKKQMNILKNVMKKVD
jgi:hypothetical protein